MFFGPVLAADMEQSPPAVAPVESGWTFVAAPYFWMPGIKGDIGVGRVGPADFGQIFDHLDWFPPPFMGAAEARNGRYAAFTDVLYVGLEADGSASGPLSLSASVDLNIVIWTFGGSYRVVDNGTATLDLLAGGRLWYLDTDLSVSSAIGSADASGSKTWVDPLIGIAGGIGLGNGFGLHAEADIGGFGAAADLDWQVVGTLQYKYNDWVTLDVGYRYLDVEYDKDGFIFDAALSGPIIGARFQF
jgi:outer membrane receptor protein involved in Fe transport